MKLRAQEGLIWRQWGDEYVVYNPVSGDSHLLDSVSARGLLHLEAQEASAPQLIEELNLSLGIALDEGLDLYVQRMIAEFSELGLARPVPD